MACLGLKSSTLKDSITESVRTDGVRQNCQYAQFAISDCLLVNVWLER